MQKDWKLEAASLAENTALSWREIAKRLGLPKSTVSDFLRKELKQTKNNNIVKSPKILFFDIETMPAVTLTFGRFDQTISQASVIKEGHILSYSYAWNDGDVKGYILSPEEIEQSDDYVIANDLNQLFNEADIIVAHYGDNFDIKVSNASFIKHGLNQPSAYKTIDTKKIASRHFKFPSNKLDSIAEYLGVGRKMETGGMQLWRDCFMKDKQALSKMLQYNKQDVVVLRDVYHRLQAWNKQTPNMANYYDDNLIRCKHCGNESVELTGKLVYTTVNAYDEYRCNKCGGLSRGKHNVVCAEKKSSLLM